MSVKRVVASVVLVTLVLFGHVAVEALMQGLRIRITEANAAQEEGVPAGAIVFIKSDTCPTGYAEDTDVNGKTIVGTLVANGNVGGTGGADTITPTGTNAAATFTGTAWTPPAIAWPAGVPTFTGNSFSSVINHTHTVTITDNGHAHVEQNNSATTGGLTGWGAADTSTNSAQATGYSTQSATTGITAATANPAGGVASITPAGTVAWPAGVPTNGAYTPAGTNSAAAFTGDNFDNRSAFIRLIACRKT